MSFFVGVDPDSSGAWAVVDDDGVLARVEDSPQIRKGARRRLDEGRVVEIAAGWRGVSIVCLEATPPLPAKMGGLFANYARGACGATWRTALAAASVPHFEALAMTWKRKLYLVKKNHAELRLVARQHWPGHAHLFARAKDHGRAAAALLALYARARHLERATPSGARA